MWVFTFFFKTIVNSFLLVVYYVRILFVLLVSYCFEFLFVNMEGVQNYKDLYNLLKEDIYDPQAAIEKFLGLQSKRISTSYKE